MHIPPKEQVAIWIVVVSAGTMSHFTDYASASYGLLACLSRFDCKRAPDIWTNDVQEQSASNGETYKTLDSTPQGDAHEVPQNLSSYEDRRQPPTPPPLFEPTHTSKSERQRQHAKQETTSPSPWCKFAISERIQTPHTVKSGARSHQASSCNERHRRPKEPEHTNGSNAARRSRKRRRTHHQTINLDQSQMPEKPAIN
jgi:hypothetical protein